MSSRSPRALVVTTVLTLAACSSASPDRAARNDVTLTVFAASSLSATFEELGKDFEATHDGVTVAFNFAGSSDLVAQIQQGAPADVVAMADHTTMDKLDGGSLVDGAPADFATNTLVIAVPPDNPAGIESLADLADPEVTLVLCAPEVPCGSAAAKVETAAGLDFRPVSEEASVTDVLGKVTSGEADAGLVYVTDVRAAGDAVIGIEFDEAARAVNTYPIATVAGAPNAELAEDFVALVSSDAGRDVLVRAGFGVP
ncbi:MAG: molybdate ABC transporter substrate-binding protein [Nocardioides sp.]